MKKIKVTLTEALEMYPIKYSTIEKYTDLPKGVLAQHIHSRRISISRLKAISKALNYIGKEMINIELKGYSDESKI